MFLPLSLSIYRDSIIHGADLYNNRSHEYDLRIFNARYEHLHYFEHISHIEFDIHESFIGVKILEEGYTISAETEHLSHLWDIGWDAAGIYAALLDEPITEIRNNGDTDVFMFSGHPGKTQIFIFAHTILKQKYP
jgi:hypothetical protein